MRSLIPFVLAIVLPVAAFGQTESVASADAPLAPVEGVELSVIDRWRADPRTLFDGSEIVLTDLQFVARPVVVFADSPNDPSYIQQLEYITSRIDELVARDVIVIVDTDPAARSDPRQTLRPRGFVLVVIGKDGRVAQRKPTPWDVREIGRAIDKLPLRVQEIREGSTLTP